MVVNNLSKAYKQYPNKWSRILEWLMPFSRPRHHLHWILQDISFALESGQALGIIGVNGAGKSTLLKVLTGTTQASFGSIAITGRVAALLELGMGFHPEFTGRQNVFMAGQLLGHSKGQLEELMDEIEQFAGIGQYIDQPVRVYSSGMQVRLAFSVATAIRPDVLIIDEALSVGDIEFQHRSFDRIRHFQKLGTTLLIVSHDKDMIMSVCDQAILINQGRIEMQGKPEAVANYYNAMLSDRPDQALTQNVDDTGAIQTQSGGGEVVLEKIQLLSQDAGPLKTVQVGQMVSLNLDIICAQPVDTLVAGYMIKDRLGQAIFGTNSFFYGRQLSQLSVGETVQYCFEFPMNLGPGTYSISIALHADENHISKNYLWLDRAILFTVVNFDKNGFVGVAWIPPTVNCTRQALGKIQDH
jgi:lipopolysaccharide transport system ATP-binding protein